MARNKMIALEQICMIFFILCITLVNCKAYPPRIESICLYECVLTLKNNDFKKFGHMPQMELEKICKDEESRLECDLKWEFDGGYIYG